MAPCGRCDWCRLPPNGRHFWAATTPGKDDEADAGEEGTSSLRRWRFTVPTDDLCLVGQMQASSGEKMLASLEARRSSESFAEVLVNCADTSDALGRRLATVLRYPASKLSFTYVSPLALEVDEASTTDWQRLDFPEAYWVVRFRASSVAALLGRHGHRSRSAELLDALVKQKSPLHQQLREAIENDFETQLLLLRAQRDSELANFLRSSRTMTTEAAVDALKREAEASTSACGSSSGRPGSARLAARAQVFLEAAQAPHVVREAMDRLRGLKRGSRQEAPLLDSLAERRHVSVVQRNESMMHYRGSGYQISGKMDGCLITDGTIVEAKTRRGWFAKPPDYDLIQLRVYMEMRGAARGLLVEKQQDGNQTRDTEVLRDAEEWRAVDEGLRAASDEIRGATMARVLDWARQASSSSSSS